MANTVETWQNFFQSCDIPANMGKKYANIFVAQRMKPDMLKDLAKKDCFFALLRDLGISALGDQLAIMRYVKLYDGFDGTPFEQDLPNNANWVTEFLFYINEGRYKSCVVALTPNYLVTFRHGTHMSYEKDSTVVRVISVNSNAEYDAKIVHICEEEDYVIMKSTENVVARECPLQECVVMKRFVVCGFGKGFPKPTFIHGTVYSNHPCVYQNNGKSFGPFVYGTAKTSLGDSGAACFGTRGLVAINLGTTKMPLTAHNEAISESAIFSPNNYMVPAYRLFEVLAKLEPKKSSKRPQHYVIDMEGYGECGI